jgi:hypothetical protein
MPTKKAATPPLSECLDEVSTPAGRERLRAVLAARPFPHFEAGPDGPGLLVRIDQDGTRTSVGSRGARSLRRRCTERDPCLRRPKRTSSSCAPRARAFRSTTLRSGRTLCRRGCAKPLTS